MMNKRIGCILFAALTAWQVRVCCECGIATVKRPKPVVKQTSDVRPQPQCTTPAGTPCPQPSQSQPKQIIR